MAKALALSAVSVLASVGCSPYGGGAFTCETDEQCGAQGQCEPNHFCSFADGSCPSGRRYGTHSGDFGDVCVGGGTGGEAGVVIDTPPPIDALFCYGTGTVTPCFPTAPTGTVPLPAQLNTDTSPLCSTTATGAAGLCVIAAATIEIDVESDVIGAKPLVLVATGQINISARLDLASHRSNNAPYTNVQLGAGADPTGGCDAGAAPGAGNNSGGGAGGSLVVGALGGNGGNGAGDNGGTRGNGQNLTTLRGGCRGQSANNGTGAQGGRGGGAVYLIAEAAINISSSINASGEGGHPGTGNNNAGGGGGSGGMIILDSPSIQNAGVIVANGGGGGEGSSGGGTAGNPGGESLTAAAAPGGNGASGTGGDGGTGSTGANAGNGQNTNAGGGGGGGGAGFIKVYRGPIMGAGDVSPPPTP